MKKTLLFSLLVLTTAFANDASAQEVTLKVTLKPIQTIVINPSQKTVNLVYRTKDNYENGVNIDKENHISIYSTGGFVVNVQSRNATLESAHTAVTKNIDAEDIIITASLGSTNPLADSDFERVELSTTATKLISNTTGGVNKSFNINYAAAGADSYVNKYFNEESPTVYTTKVLYTIEAQ